MNLENNYHYLVGYFEDNQFWAVDESSVMNHAQKMLEKHKQIFPKKNFCVVRRHTSYEILQDGDVNNASRSSLV
jgi:hypothetical protein